MRMVVAARELRRWGAMAVVAVVQVASAWQEGGVNGSAEGSSNYRAVRWFWVLLGGISSACGRSAGQLSWWCRAGYCYC